MLPEPTDADVDRPDPGRVDSHHVEHWATRHQHAHGTDLLDGLPFCGFHDRLMEQGWEIRFDEHRVPWFTPPPAVDLWQRPVRGGNLAHPDAAWIRVDRAAQARRAAADR